MRRSWIALALAILAAMSWSPLAVADGTYTDNADADGDGTFVMTIDAPIGNNVTCTMVRNWSINYDSVFFSGRSSCAGGQFNMAMLYGRAAVLEGGAVVAWGSEERCTTCGSVFSGGAAGVFPGFPYTLRYQTTLQLPPGYQWLNFPGSCARAGYPTIVCSFYDEFVA